MHPVTTTVPRQAISFTFANAPDIRNHSFPPSVLESFTYPSRVIALRNLICPFQRNAPGNLTHSSHTNAPVVESLWTVEACRKYLLP